MRGYRIELGEVEAALQKNPLVKQAAVVINKAGAEATLNAFIKLQDDAESINTFQLSNITQTQIKELYNDIFAEYEAEKIALANSILEEYVLYSILEYLKENHLTQNKKIDFSLMKQKESIKSEYHWLIKRWLDKLCECGKLVSTNEDVYELKSDNINEKVKIYRESLYSTWNNEIMPETFILYIDAPGPPRRGAL